MALNPTTLSAALKSALLANTDAKAINNTALTALCDCIAQAVIVHITTQGVVIGTSATGGPVTGVVT